jgi:EPS-associated MarR family transcriptional regulator
MVYAFKNERVALASRDRHFGWGSSISAQCGSRGGNTIVRQVVSSTVSWRRDDLQFRALRLLERRPGASQREIATELGISLGAANYCIRALIDAGDVKLARFRASPNKLGYAYCLTPEGLTRKALMACAFLERKLAEYEAIQLEIDELRAEGAAGRSG